MNPATRNKIKRILTASIFNVFGVLGERVMFILPGEFLAIPLVPGYEVSSAFQDGQVITYFPHIAERTQFVGIFAFITLACIMGLRMLPLLPDEGNYVKEEHVAEMTELTEAVATT